MLTRLLHTFRYSPKIGSSIENKFKPSSQSYLAILQPNTPKHFSSITRPSTTQIIRSLKVKPLLTDASFATQTTKAENLWAKLEKEFTIRHSSTDTSCASLFTYSHITDLFYLNQRRNIPLQEKTLQKLINSKSNFYYEGLGLQTEFPSTIPFIMLAFNHIILINYQNGCKFDLAKLFDELVNIGTSQTRNLIVEIALNIEHLLKQLASHNLLEQENVEQLLAKAKHIPKLIEILQEIEKKGHCLTQRHFTNLMALTDQRNQLAVVAILLSRKSSFSDILSYMGKYERPVIENSGPRLR